MPRARTSKSRLAPPRRAQSAPPSVLVADAADFDAKLGVYTLFFDIPRFEVVYFRLVIESWEDGAVARTILRHLEDDPARTLVVALVVPDFLEPCLRRLGRLCAEIDGVQVPGTPALLEALREGLASREKLTEDDRVN
jgi:hypothetical protein